MKTCAVTLLFLAFIATFPPASHGDPTPPAAEKAPAKYRLTRQGVAGLAAPRFVFVIVTPQGTPWVATAEKLHWMVEQAVPADATLEWDPGCKRIGGEQLETAEELDALKALCAERKVTFVILPAG